MSESQKKQLFIEVCLTKKERVFLSDPLNTRLEDMYRAFKIALELSHEM
jgi:hypothetical protein